MSEPIWCNISVHIPERWVVDGKPPAFLEALGEALLNGEGPHPEVVYREGRERTERLDVWCVSGEGNYGLYDSEVEPIIDLMRDARIPFVAIQDAKYEMIGEIQVFDPANDRAWSGEYSESGPVLSRSGYRNIIAGKSDVATVEEFFERLSVDAGDLSIDHLAQALPPHLDGGDNVQASDIINALAKVGVTARVEHTGGGVATLIVDRSAAHVLIGPGVYHWGDERASTFHFDELSVGLDGDAGASVGNIDQLVITTLVIAGSDPVHRNPNQEEA